MFDIYGLTISPVIKEQNGIEYIREADTHRRALITVKQSTRFNTWAIVDACENVLEIYSQGKLIVTFDVSQTYPSLNIHEVTAWLLYQIKV